MLGNWSLRRLLQEGSDRVGVGTARRALEVPAERALRHRLPARRPGDPAECDQEAYDLWAENLRRRRARSGGPHRQRQQEGQLLDDGRDRPVRPVHGNPHRPHAGRRHRRARSVNSGDARVHRDLEHRLHPVQRRTPTARFSAAARPARRYRHGLRARLRDHPRHEELHRFRNAEPRNYETDVFRPIFDELEKLSGRNYGGTLPGAGRRRAPDRAGEGRRRLPRHRRSHPHAQLLHRRRHPARQHRPQLRPAPHPPPRRALRPHPRLAPRHAVLLSSSCRRWSRRWARSFPNCAKRAGEGRGGARPGGDELQPDARPGHRGSSTASWRSARERRTSSRRGRVPALRHLRLSLDLTAAHGRRAGLTVDLAGFDDRVAETKGARRRDGRDASARSAIDKRRPHRIRRL